MKALPYFRWYPADAETDHLYASLNDTELGFFHRCLNRSWINGGLPSDLDELAAIMRLSRSQLDRLWSKVGRCFQPSDDGKTLHNRRQEEERTHATAKSERASDAVRTRYGRRSNESPRAYVSEYDSSSEEINNVPQKIPKRPENAPPWSEVNAAWKWLKTEYPGEVNEFTDLQLFIAVMVSPEDLVDLYRTLPLWKATKRWQDGFHKELKNFISERIFKITPKVREPTSSKTTVFDRVLARAREEDARNGIPYESE